MFGGGTVAATDSAGEPGIDILIDRDGEVII